MKILAIETATEACSAALLIDDEITQRFEISPQKHTQLILPMCEALLAEAALKPTQLDAIAFGRGPGSFTGVRIAAGVTQGIAYGADLPVVPVSSLMAAAYNGYQKTGHEHLAVALDARMQQVYFGVFNMAENPAAFHSLQDEVVASVPDLTLPDDQQYCGIGPGWAAYQAELNEHFGDQVISTEPDLLPDAQAVVQIAKIQFTRNNVVAPEQAIPTYLRNNVATPRANKKA
jgi:tRNA threonylcarbamoyladenosine biosynthesis protein TsaB